MCVSFIFSDQKGNLRLMQELGLVGKLLHILKDPNLSRITMQTIASVLTVLLSGATHAPSILRFVLMCNLSYMVGDSNSNFSISYKE